MDVLLVLLALPFLTAAVILAGASLRRRAHATSAGHRLEPVHRLQADSGAVQSAAVRPARSARRLSSGRERRAATSARRQRQ